MRVFLTGSTGYVGARVARLLLGRGHDVVGLVRSDASAEAARAAGLDVVRGDLADPGSPSDPSPWPAAARSADAVVHTAFDHGADFFGAVDAERAAVRAVLDALREEVAGGAARVFVGSNGTGVLGDTGPTPAPEDAPVPSEDENPVARRARVEALAREASGAGVRTAVVRLPVLVHGHGASQFVPALVALARERGAAPYVSDGRNRLSGVHVDDAARAFVAAAEGLASGAVPSGRVFHAAAAEPVTGRALAEAAARAAGVGRTESVAPADAADVLGPFLSLFLGMDNAVASGETRDVLGWTPEGVGLLDDLRTGSYAGGPGTVAAPSATPSP